MPQLNGESTANAENTMKNFTFVQPSVLAIFKIESSTTQDLNKYKSFVSPLSIQKKFGFIFGYICVIESNFRHFWNKTMNSN